MGRKRTRLLMRAAQRAEVVLRIQAATGARGKDRLRFALLAANGEHTLEELAKKLGRSRSTLQLWLEKFRAGGLAGLLERDTPPGLVSPLGSESIQDELNAGLKVGRWGSAREIAEWLEEVHGIKRSRKSIYYWLGKQRRPAPGRLGKSRPTKQREQAPASRRAPKLTH